MNLKSIIKALECLYKSYGEDNIKVSSINALNNCIKVFYYHEEDDERYEFTWNL